MNGFMGAATSSVAIAILICAFVVGDNVGRAGIVGDCNDIGAFKYRGVVYACSVKEKK